MIFENISGRLAIIAGTQAFLVLSKEVEYLIPRYIIIISLMIMAVISFVSIYIETYLNFRKKKTFENISLLVCLWGIIAAVFLFSLTYIEYRISYLILFCFMPAYVAFFGIKDLYIGMATDNRSIKRRRMYSFLLMMISVLNLILAETLSRHIYSILTFKGG